MSAPDRGLEVGVQRAGVLYGGLPRGLLIAIFATLLLAALCFSTLRARIITLRYRTAEVVREERALEEARREAAVRVRKLRDPRRLVELARQRGFARPERVIDLQKTTRSGVR